MHSQSGKTEETACRRSEVNTAFIMNETGNGVRVFYGNDEISGRQLARFVEFLNGQGRHADDLPRQFRTACDDFMKTVE